MDLIQRKRILNMPRFNNGDNDGTMQDGKIGNTGIDNFKLIKGLGKIRRIINKEAIDNAIAIGKDALSIGQNMMSSLNVPGTSEIVNNAGQSDNSVMGVNYQEQNLVDGSQELKEQDSKGFSNTQDSVVSGAAAGLKVGGIWGGVIGGVAGLGSGLFGWLGGKSKLKRRIRRAKMAAANKASLQRSNALTQGLQNEYYLNNDNTADDILYT